MDGYERLTDAAQQMANDNGRPALVVRVKTLTGEIFTIVSIDEFVAGQDESIYFAAWPRKCDGLVNVVNMELYRHPGGAGHYTGRDDVHGMEG